MKLEEITLKMAAVNYVSALTAPQGSLQEHKAEREKAWQDLQEAAKLYAAANEQ